MARRKYSNRVISFSHHGDFEKTETFLGNLKAIHYRHKLEKYGQKGVDALKKATPKRSGKTADSWSYEIIEAPGKTSLYWKNSNMNDGVNIAIILQYGHGTRGGTWVEGIDYINPALAPIFEEMANEVWKEVISG